MRIVGKAVHDLLVAFCAGGCTRWVALGPAWAAITVVQSIPTPSTNKQRNCRLVLRLTAGASRRSFIATAGFPSHSAALGREVVRRLGQ